MLNSRLEGNIILNYCLSQSQLHGNLRVCVGERIKKTTLHQQLQAIAMNLQSVSKHVIVRHLQVVRSTIHGILKKYRREARVED